MNTLIISLVIAISQAILLPQAVADSSNASEVKLNQPAKAMRMPMYLPPRRGAPNIRVGGGTRGITGATPVIQALAPEHVGLTAKAQPSLSWYMSKPGSMRVEVLLANDDEMDPLLELTIDASKLKEGIQSINLADYGVKLKPGMQYQWSVVLVPEAGHRSGDIVSSGMIELKKSSGSLKSKLSKSKPQDNVFVYAQEGYWYDAIAELTALIKKDPGNKVLKQQRNDLLTQVGLLEIKSDK